MTQKREGQVYLIRADNNLYKIGQTMHSAERRFKGMQGSCACTLELLWFIAAEDRLHLEDALHRLFAKSRHHGEWFALSEREVDFILALDAQTISALLVARAEARNLDKQANDPTG